MVQSYMQGKGEKGVLEQNCTVGIFLKIYLAVQD